MRGTTAALATILTITLALAAPPPAPAEQILYGDGGTHTIDGVSSPIFVFNQTTVNLLPGASIVGAFADDGGGAIVAWGATIHASGGTFAGDSGTDGEGLGAEGSVVTITAGSFTGGDGAHAGRGAGFTFGGTTAISGGTFTGGAAVGPGAIGGVGALIIGGTFAITGGAFAGGAGSGALAGTALALGASGWQTSGTISGGTFADASGGANAGGSLSLFGADGDAITVSGGHFAGGIALLFREGFETVRFAGATPLLYGGGKLDGLLADGSAIDVDLTVTTFGNATVRVLREGNDLVFTTVPEPGSAVGMGVGLAAVAGLGFRLQDKRREC